MLHPQPGPAKGGSEFLQAPVSGDMDTSFAAERPEHQIRGGLADWQLRKVIRHVDEHLGTSLACEDLAALVRLSTGHFCRAFKSSVGEPPHTYLIRQRIRRAQRLMVETRDSLSQIACACGLTDQAHLTRLFRKSVGTTPRVWRVRRLAAAAA